MSKRIPRYCDEMLQVGPIEADELGVILFVIFLGIITDNMLWGIVAAFFMSRYVSCVCNRAILYLLSAKLGCSWVTVNPSCSLPD